MKNNIHVFSKKESAKNQEILDKVGIRGREAIDFSSLNLPILPGFIIDSDVASSIYDTDLTKNLKKYMKKIEQVTQKIYGDPAKPMLVKIVISPNLAIVRYPTLHNYGLTDNTMAGFDKFVGEKFSSHELQFCIKGNLEIELRIAELEKRTKDFKTIEKALDSLSQEMGKPLPASSREKSLGKYKSLLPDGFFSDVYTQLELAVQRISKMLELDEMNDDDAAIIIQPMVHGNFGKDSASGSFFTRNVVTGEKKLQGFFEVGKFDTVESEGKDINKIGNDYLKELQRIAGIVEDQFKEIRRIRFTIENDKVWLIDQRALMTKSTQAEIQTLLDLNRRKIIDENYVLNAIKPGQLNEILHPIIDKTSVKSLQAISGGIAGAPGAAIGKVYFTTDTLIEARKEAIQRGEDPRFILCMSATFAEDVKAIEVSTGVLSNEGGYAAHASVVARQYGKVSLVKTDMKIRGNKATIGKITINEGDYISVSVPNYGDPEIYLGKAGLIEPDPKKSGLLDFIEIINKHMPDFHVRANADTPRDAKLARDFGARGIGLCRTEHMFFDEKRINVFRQMILSDSTEERIKVLTKLKTIQKNDFYQLFKIMEGDEVTIRLLDAPLHEFLPHNKDEMEMFMKYLKTQYKGKPVPKAEIQAKMNQLNEFNPMLGHRGCRIAISYPEIYHAQTEAIFEAAYALKKEGKKIFPEIMIPLIGNENELKMIIYGKRIEGTTYKGLMEIEEEVRKKLKAKPIEFKVGTMIELPVAALGAGKIAKYAQFFSFGTNDLTQTTLGLSRDDFNSFMPDYTQFDLLTGNPFAVLDEQVKELVATAVQRGRITRPDIKKGLCGEHGAVPENIKFCMNVGLDYVSCSTYSVPIAGLAIAQFHLQETAGNK